MPNSSPKNGDSAQISRREAIAATLIAAATMEVGGRGAIAAETASAPGVLPMDPDLAAYLKGPGGKLEYFQDYVGVGSNYRGDKVKPWELSEEKLSAAGLTRETWTLDVISDDGKLLDNPRAKAAGNAITYADVLRLAEQRPVRVLKTLVCLGMDHSSSCGLWEGAALRDVLWLARPKGAIRRIAFHSLQPDDQAKQEWCSSLPPARVFEDPPGMAPVMLALKYNGRWLTPRMGGPVRLIVHEHYGFKNTRHLRRVVFTHQPEASDDYIKIGQDVESPTKTIAMVPKVCQKEPLMFGGQVLVGFSGLKTVQYALIPDDRPLPDNDPYLLSLPWKDGMVLPRPPAFAASIPGGARSIFGLSGDGTPLEWPIPSFLAYWISPPVRDLKPGKYKAYARAVNRHGDAQPLPRPFDASGRTAPSYCTFRRH